MATQFNSDNVIASSGIRPSLTNITTSSALNITESGGGGVVRYVHKYTGATSSYTAAGSTWNQFPSSLLAATITPTSTNNGVLIYVRWCGEVAESWNTTFGVKRNGTIITNPGRGDLGFYTPQSSQNYGLAVGRASYVVGATNFSTTPESCDFWFYDLPQSNQALTYELTIRQQNGTGSPIYLNRTQNDSNINTRERMTSAIDLYEICRVI